MKHYKWDRTKPAFTEECVLIVANYFGRDDRQYENRQYEYTLYEIKKLDGETEEGEYAWYWGVLCSDGEEWGDLNDLTANLYMTLPLLKGDPNAQEGDATEDDSSNGA